MKNKILFTVFFLYAISFFSCAGRNYSRYIPIPDGDFLGPEVMFDFGNITGTRDGVSGFNMPEWLFAYINGGNREIERMFSFSGKYAFVGFSEGNNLSAMTRWAENFSAERDFSILAATRIERRLINAAALYPDDEYGAFFERMVKTAYGTRYSGAVKEDTYWITVNYGSTPSETYVFFVLLSIDRTQMQAVVSNMISESVAAVTLTRTQHNSINRLRNNFFEGF